MTPGTNYSPPPAFGRFRLLHQIGAGVLGPVFRTHDPDEDRLVAVKVFTLDLIPEQAEQLAEELRRLAAVDISPARLAAPVDAGVEETVAYLAQQYVAGESLDAAIRQYGPAPATDAARLISHVADALDAGARVGVFHGALHPRDILVTPGETHLTGLGVATALERVGVRSPVRRPYAAPEREAGGQWGAAADVFALAAIAHEVLTGRRALPGTEEPLPGLDEVKAADPAQLRELLEAALDPDPERRPATATEFATAFAAALGLVAGAQAQGARSRRRQRAKPAPKLPGLDEPLVPPVEQPSAETEASADIGPDARPDPGTDDGRAGPVSALLNSARPDDSEPEAPLDGGAFAQDAALPGPLESMAPEPLAIEIPVAMPPEPGPVEPGGAEPDSEEPAPAEAVEDLGDIDLGEIDAEPAPGDQFPLMNAPAPDDDLRLRLTPRPEDLPRPEVPPDIQALSDELERFEPSAGQTPEVVRRSSRRGAGTAPSIQRPVAAPTPPDLDAMREPGTLVSEPPVPRALDPATRTPSPSRRVEPYRPLPPRERAAVIPVGIGAAVGLAIGVLLGFWLWGTGRSVPAAVTPGPASSQVSSQPAPGVGTGVGTPRGAQGPIAPAQGQAPATQASTPSVQPAVPAAAPPAEPTSPRGDAAQPEARTGAIRVRTTPSAADVFLDGERQGVTPRNLLDVPFGKYTVRVTRPGYVPAERVVTLGDRQPDQRVEFRLERTRRRAASPPPKPAPAPSRPPARVPDPSAEVRPAVVAGAISIETRPPGARVRLDGRDVGVAPLVLGEVAVGSHTLRLEMDGYRVWSTTVAVKAGERLRVAASLERSTRQ